MLAPDNEGRPQAEEPAGVKSTTVDEVQVNGGAAEQAIAAVVSELPPPYPSTTKAGGFKFELDIERMHQSDTWAIAEKRQRPFLVMVWIESWTQLPAGSLPGSDTVIAARIGMPLPEFKASREVLMRGWWKASDGRLYHPVVTEQVFDMVKRKTRKAANQAAYRDRQRMKDEGEAEVSDHQTGTDLDVTGHPGVTDCTTTTTTTTTKQQDQKQSSTAAPLTADTGDGKAEGQSETERRQAAAAARATRLAQVTRDAIETFNESKLTKLHGGLVPNVDAAIGATKRQKQVSQCLTVARDICRKDFESELIVRDFWVEYWDACLADDHKSGRAGGGKDHGNWVPSFEYLTREATMLEVYDRLAGGQA